MAKMEPLEQEQQELQEQNDLTREEDEGPKLSAANYANGLFFVAGVSVVCICKFTNLLGNFLDVALAQYATILSPSYTSWDTMFLLWVCIFAFETLFVIAQFTCFRDHEVVKAISFWWVIQCMLQIAFFLLLMPWASFVPIWITAGVLVANFTILMLIIAIIEFLGKRTFVEFWCLRAPFSMHAGFLLCESIVWLNVLLQVRSDNEDGVVIATSMTGMTAVLTLTTVLAMAVPRPDGLFCAGVCYTYYWVALELLCDPNVPNNNCRANLRTKLGMDVVSDETLGAFQYAALGICFIAGCLAVLAWGLRFAACCQRGRV